MSFIDPNTGLRIPLPPPPRPSSPAHVQAPPPPPTLVNILRGVGGSSGSGPVAQDPAYQQAQADEQAAIDAARAARDASINQALIQFGMVPDLQGIGASLGFSPQQLATIMGSINGNTGALADQYTKTGNSVLGQLSEAHDRALSSLRASLAARGALSSGATGVGVGLENQNYQHNLSSAYTNLLNSLTGYEGTFTSAQQQAKSALESAANDAYNRAVQMAEQNPGLYSAASPSTPTHIAPAVPKPKPVPRIGGLSSNARQGVYTIH